MSDYVVRRIASSPRITLHTQTEITVLLGEDTLTSVTWTDRASGVSETRKIRNVLVMIGAMPNTGWLADCLALDQKGLVPPVSKPTVRRPRFPTPRSFRASTLSAMSARAR
ncbi:hypothetical protein [Methylobacterium sp. CM6244]